LSNLVKFFLLICILFAVMHFVNSSPPRFTAATGTLAAYQLTPAGQAVSVAVDPRATRYLALYHSAGWCGPCHAFTPRLEEYYEAAGRAGRKFQLVMINLDRSQEDMLAYLREQHVQFPAVLRRFAGDWGRSTGNGIPNLMIIDTQTGRVVSSCFQGDEYVGPSVPLAALESLNR
jgi:thiol-disulfide isomerase/thioredoxin